MKQISSYDDMGEYLMKRTILTITLCIAFTALTIACGNNVPRQTEPVTTEKQIESSSEEPSTDISETLRKIETGDQVLSAIKNYCFANNPELEDMVKSGDYTIYWEIESSTDNQVVVLFRSYTGAELRYYIDSVSGDTYVTEFVKGITDGEQRTEETFNAWDYVDQ